MTRPVYLSDLDQGAQEFIAAIERCRGPWGRTPVGKTLTAQLVATVRAISPEMAEVLARYVDGKTLH